MRASGAFLCVLFARGDIHRHKLGEVRREILRRVFLGEIDREKHALVVVGGDDQVLLAVEEITHFLRLMPGDDHHSRRLFRANVSHPSGVMLRPQMS